MVDTGALVYATVSRSLAHQMIEELGIVPLPLSKPIPYTVADGRSGKPITYKICPHLQVKDHWEATSPLLIMDLGNHDMLLGKGWLQAHGALPDANSNSVTFKPNFYTHPGRPAAAEPRKLDPTTPPKVESWRP
ncbi:hypothetical protein ASPGLDRAFT_125098 [Neofusicoccum parvum]|nr:hypothetical protein ASPGLDRAFT_125098 [Neofusicoccum parvum]